MTPWSSFILGFEIFFSSLRLRMSRVSVKVQADCQLLSWNRPQVVTPAAVARCSTVHVVLVAVIPLARGGALGHLSVTALSIGDWFSLIVYSMCLKLWEWMNKRQFISITQIYLGYPTVLWFELYIFRIISAPFVFFFSSQFSHFILLFSAYETFFKSLPQAHSILALT